MSATKIISICVLAIFLFSCGVVSQQECSNIRLQVLGAGGPEIDDQLASSSYLIWIDGKATIMVDSGGGSSFNFEQSGASFNDLKAILLTHLHVDHSAALPVYIKAGYFTNRQKTLPIFGPSKGGVFPSTEQFVASLFSDQQQSAYPYLSDNLRQQSSTDFLIEVKSVKPNNKVWRQPLVKGIILESINVSHGTIPAIAWRVNVGECSIAFSGDMNGSSGHLQRLAAGANLLVANNAIPSDANPVAQRLHMTPEKIAEIANDSKPAKLLLSHFMLRTMEQKEHTVKLIEKTYSGEIMLAKELDFIDLD